MPYQIQGQLTAERLDELKPGIFATGTISDNPNGINMNNSDRLLRWVAVRGYAPDWAIYVHYAEFDESYVQSSGDKVGSTNNIKKLIDVNDDAMKRYRY